MVSAQRVDNDQHDVRPIEFHDRRLSLGTPGKEKGANQHVRRCQTHAALLTPSGPRRNK
jgi:hypothetical protein